MGVLVCEILPGKRCPDDTCAKAIELGQEYQAAHPEGPVVDPTAQVATLVRAESDESPFRKRYESMDEKLAAFQTELDKAVSDLDDDANWHAYLETMSTFHHYSFQNQMLIAMQRPDATQVAGFNTWKKLGRHVMKGEKGIAILAPKTVRVAVTDANGKPRLDANGKPIKEPRVVGFTTATVFDVSQTDGKALPSIARELSEGEAPVGFTENLEAAISAEGFEIVYEPIQGTARGYTSPKEKKVVIDSTMNAASRAKTLAHELGHIKAGHLERIEDYHTGHGGERGVMEVEAESIAFVLCRNAGMTNPQETSATYVRGWGAVQRTPEQVRESSERIAKTVKSILSAPAWKAEQEPTATQGVAA